MAKGSFLGVKRGKLGDAVGYNVANSSDGVKQGWRVYQPVVSNPQTDGQIDQRIKLTAVNNLYRALKPIIQRGWENHKYGDESRRAFLKRALGSAFVGPYLVKGSTLAVPIEGVPITYGSLTPVVVVCDNGEVVLTNVPYDSGYNNTIGSLSGMFISASLAQQGDQVTFIFASLNEAGTVSYLTRSFYVDSNSTELTVDVLGFSVNSETYDGNVIVAIGIDELTGFSETHYAAMVSISRDGETSNLRSYAEFDMTTEFRSYFYGSTSQVERAKASYRKKVSADTNWPLVPGGESGGGGSTVTAFTLSGTEIVPGSLTNVAAEPAEIVDANGQHYFVRAHTSAGGTRYLYGQGGGDFTSSATAPTGATNANTIDPCAANNVASGCRAWLLAKGVSADLLVIA